MTSTHLDGGGKIAVVGAAGFIGRSVVTALKQAERPYVAFTRSTPLIAGGSLSGDAEGISAVIWLASSINPLVAESNPELVASDLRVLQETSARLRDEAPDARFVLVSSGGSVYGDQRQPPYRETDPTAPASAYGAAKLAMEHIVLETSPDAVVLRIANAYGPGQPIAPGQGVIAHWMRAIRRNEPVRVFGDTRTTRDYVFANDVAEGLISACDAPAPSAIVNIGSGAPTSLADLLHLILRVVDRDRVMVEYVSARMFDVSASYLDITSARETLTWKPTTNLMDGLSRTWQSVLRYGDILT